MAVGWYASFVRTLKTRKQRGNSKLKHQVPPKNRTAKKITKGRIVGQKKTKEKVVKTYYVKMLYARRRKVIKASKSFKKGWVKKEVEMANIGGEEWPLFETIEW